MAELSATDTRLVRAGDPVRTGGGMLAVRTLAERDRRVAEVGRPPRTIRVELDGSGDFACLADAVASSGPRDTILVGEGFHHVDDLLLTGRRTLRGSSGDPLGGMWDRPPAWRPGDPTWDINDDDAPDDGFSPVEDYEGQDPFVGSGMTPWMVSGHMATVTVVVGGTITVRDDASIRDLTVTASGFSEDSFDERPAVRLAGGWPTVTDILIRQNHPKRCLEVSSGARPLVARVRVEGDTRWTGGAGGRADRLTTNGLIVESGARPSLVHCSAAETTVSGGARPDLRWCSVGSQFAITALEVTGAATTCVLVRSEIIGGRFGAVVSDGAHAVLEDCTLGSTWTPGRLLVHPWMQQRLEPDHPELAALIRSRRSWTFGLARHLVPEEWRDVAMFPIDIRDPGSSAVIDLCRFFGPGLIGYEDPASVSVERSTWEQDVLHRYTRTLRFLDLDPSARSF